MSRARRSTLAHLQRLAATTAVAVACNHGYAVVDPMPTAARCDRNAQFKATAVWRKQQGGDAGASLELVVTMTKLDPAAGDVTFVPASDIASITKDAQGNTEVVFHPRADVTTVLAVYNLVCAAGTDTKELEVFWSAPPVEGRVEQVAM